MMSPRKTQEELEQAVVTAINDLGPNVEYSALVDQLNDTGNGQAVPLLRGMKHRGVINLYLAREGDAIVHYATLPDAGADIPF